MVFISFYSIYWGWHFIVSQNTQKRKKKQAGEKKKMVV
jgi:hypothetical protein